MLYSSEIFLPKFTLNTFSTYNAGIDKCTLVYDDILLLQQGMNWSDLMEYLSFLAAGNIFIPAKLKQYKSIMVNNKKFYLASDAIRLRKLSNFDSIARYALNLSCHFNCNRLIDNNALQLQQFQQASFYRAFNKRRRLSDRYLNKIRSSLNSSDNMLSEQGFNISRGNVIPYFLSSVSKIADGLLEGFNGSDNVPIDREFSQERTDLLRQYGGMIGIVGLQAPKICHFEVNWDFYVDDAYDFMRVIEQPFFRIADHPKQKCRENNFWTFEVNLRSDESIKLAIYPRTLNRIRLEVRYFKSLRTLLSRSIPQDVRGGAELEYLARVAVQDASQKAQKFVRLVLQNMPKKTFSLPMDKTVSLVHATHEATGKNIVASCQIINALTDTGSISVNRNGGVLNEALELLRRGGFVSRLRGPKKSKTYELRKKYAGYK